MEKTGWKTTMGAVLAGLGALIGVIAPHLSDGSPIPWGEVAQRGIEIAGLVLGAIGIGHKMERAAKAAEKK